ncbi:MAG TPA: helix-turn-helix domain-containing protein [Solirubrobacteraceae bacterium]|jgi:AcrR family transcriptional regulator
MGRPARPTEPILDAARDLLAAGGTRAATVEAISERGAVSIGSIYYRFSSVDELLAHMWLRAVGRSHEAALAVVEDGDAPEDVVLAVALALYDFCLCEPNEARVLATLRAEDLLGRGLSSELERELREANAAVMPLIDRLARRCFGRTGGAGRDLLLLAIVDLPYGAARRQSQSGGSAHVVRREALATAIEAMLARALAERGALAAG